MATTEITVTLPQDQVQEIRALAAAGEATSVSGFVQPAVGIALHDAAGRREMLEDALQQTGGPLTKKEGSPADSFLGGQEGKKGSKKERLYERHHFRCPGLMALDRKDRRVLVLLVRAKQLGMRITVPAPSGPGHS